MTLDQTINILVTVSLIELMVAVGLAVNLVDLTSAAMNPRLVLSAVLANYVCVPAVAVVLLWWLRVEPMIAAGILIATACSDGAE